MNIRTRMMYKAILLWGRKGYVWVDKSYHGGMGCIWVKKEKRK